MASRVLVVEDDEPLGRQVEGTLRAAGWDVSRVRRGDDALSQDLSSYALVVLDLMLPGAHGLDVLRAARRTELQVPVLVLSARKDTTDKVRALELGADDYLTKPFWPEELVARVRARLRRPSLDSGDGLRVGAIEIDLAARAVRVGSRPIDLTRAEFELLAALTRRPGAAVSRVSLVERALRCASPDEAADERSLDAHVSRLRRKLGAAASQLETVWGIGYRLAGES